MIQREKDREEDFDYEMAQEEYKEINVKFKILS